MIEYTNRIKDINFFLKKNTSVVPRGIPGPGDECRVCPSAMSAATPVGAATSTLLEPLAEVLKNQRTRTFSMPSHKSERSRVYVCMYIRVTS